MRDERGWWVVGPLVAAALLVASFLSPAAAAGPTVVAIEYVPTHFNLSRMITIRPGDDYSAGEVERNRWENLQHLKPTDEIKFVIGTMQDYKWMKQQIAANHLF